MMLMTIPNELKAALYTALWTFIGTALIGLTGFLGAVLDFLNGTDTDITDDLSALGTLVASAFVAAVSGLVGWGIRYAGSKTGKLQAPDYSHYSHKA